MQPVLTKPLISCKCITYGRVHFLEEALYSFIHQEYDGPKELVIVNDYPLQKLKFDHPDVRIYNLDQTFNTIGEKENYATELCNGEIICQWDDDDIALPNHLNNVAKHFTDDVDILHWQTGVFFDFNLIKDIAWIGNSGIVFRKSAWKDVGGHPIENAGYDMKFVEKMHRRKHRLFCTLPKHEASWFYMWGGRGYHMSGLGDDKPGKPNVIQRHSAHVELERINGKIPTGEVVLNPHWNVDYKQMLSNFVKQKYGTS